MKVQRFILLCHARQSMSPIECSKGILGKFIFKSNLASAAELILGRLQEGRLRRKSFLIERAFRSAL
jgi:hypothetical protein